MVALKLVLFSFALCDARNDDLVVDSRNVFAGDAIGTMTSGYADQPMVLVRPDGAWLCSATHNPSHEGGAGEAVYTTISKDQGKTWSATLPLEIQSNEQYAYSTLFPSNLPSGRIYNIYVQNYQNITTDPKTGKKLPREDMMGGFFLKYSDDGGNTWSKQKWQIPVRKTYIDDHNEWNGTVRLEWLVDKGFQHGDAAYVAFTKIGMYMVGPPTSGWILFSPNIGSAKTPDDIQWVTLPDDDKGIRSYNDSMVAAGCGFGGAGTNGCFTSESHVVPLDMASLNTTMPVQHLYTVFRTSSGFMGAQVSHDGGKSFQDLPVDEDGNHRPWALHRTEPGSPAVTPRPLKQPRGPMTPRRLPVTMPGAADFLMFYYNDGWTDVSPHLGDWTHRNPYWLVPGWIDVKNDKSGNLLPQGILWGEPEVGLYVPGVYEGVGSGYPDFIVNTTAEGAMRLWITETQKSAARVHLVDDNLLQALLHQKTSKNTVPPAVSFSGADVAGGKNVTVPVWPKLPEPSHSTTSPPTPMLPRQGFAVTMWFAGLGKASNDGKFTLFQSGGVSIAEVARPNGKPTLQLLLEDVKSNKSVIFMLDEQCSAWLTGTNPSMNSSHFVGISIDAGSRVITAVVDGVFCDGGPQSWQLHPSGNDRHAFNGWQFLPIGLNDVGGKGIAHVGLFQGSMNLYSGYLLTGEMLGIWRAGEKAEAIYI